MLNNETGYKNLSFWSWNDKMECEEVISQVQQFKEKGFGGFFIHSRAGLNIEYMGKDWFSLCKIATEEAKKQSLEVYLYDEDGWPSGFSGGKIPALGEDYQFKRLYYSFENPNVEDKYIICCFINNNGSFKRTENKEKADIYFYYAVDCHYVDIMSKKVVKEFIDSTHNVYKKELGEYFGSVIKGIFTDEPQLSNGNLTWSFELTESFGNLYHYNLLDNLYMLAVECDGYRKFRHDFYKAIGKLVTESFSIPIYNWCNENNLVSTGHFSCEDSIIEQTMCNGGVMPNYEYFHIPVIYNLGRRKATPVLLKQVTSVAKQMGYDSVLSETFGCSGWNVPFSELTHIWAWQASFGVNLACIHLSAYSIRGIRKRDYPAFFSYQEPWWDKLESLSNWMNNLNKMLSEGSSKSKTLVINPISSIWSEFTIPYKDISKNISNQYRLAIENLIDIQIDFDIGDEQLLEKYGYIENGEIVLNNCRYSNVIVPYCTSLEKSSVKLLKQYIKSGAEVVFINDKPKYIEGEMADFSDFGNQFVIQNKREFFRKYFDNKHYVRSITVYEKNSLVIATLISVKINQIESNKRMFIVNKLNDAVRNFTVVAIGEFSVYLIEPKTKKRKLLNSYKNGGNTFCDLEIGCFGTALLDFDINVSIANSIKVKSVEEYNNQVRVCDENSLTLDYGCFSINSSEFSQVMPIIKMHEIIYENVNALKCGAEVKIKYNFEINTHEKIKNISMCLENEKCKTVEINGNDIKTETSKWWIDKCIGVYKIESYVENGNNEVILTYLIPVFNAGFNIEETYETERNRFHYPVEPESIYIKGNFDVLAIGEKLILQNCIKIKNAKFSIVNSSEKKPGLDMTQQGLWFYRGNLEYVSKVNMPSENQRIIIEISNSNAVLAEIFVNDKSAGELICYPFELDITECLTKYENIVVVRLYGSNRNLLGPHHHVKGENYFVGVSTFKGVWGFEDYILNFDITDTNTWTDDYSFVYFGNPNITIKTIVNIK